MKVIINILGLILVTINKIIRYYNTYNFIIIDKKLAFLSNFLFLLYYFIKIQQRFFMALIFKSIAKSRDKMV